MAAERVFGVAMRRGQRLLRAFHRHVQWQVKFELATVLHHRSGLVRSKVEKPRAQAYTQTDIAYVAPAPVDEYITPDLAVYTASAPVNEYVDSARVIEYVAAPALPCLSSRLCRFLMCRSSRKPLRLL